MITLRPVNPAKDAPALHAVFGDEQQCRYLLRPAFKSIAQTQAQLETYGRDSALSIRLCERLGFRYEGTLRNQWHTHLGVRDTDMMSLIEEDPRPWRPTT
ncbi:MAG: GNAT family protein [Pseudomonadota bacterium]